MLPFFMQAAWQKNTYDEVFSLNRDKVAAFFDQRAPEWDQSHHHDSNKLQKILDYAGINHDSTVLDVACGTGVLFPFYLQRHVKEVTGVDLSSGMIARAKEKFSDPRIKLIHGDVEEVFLGKYSRCVVYSAFPHFEHPTRLIETLINHLEPNGRLTIAHSESKEMIDQRHKYGASEVSNGLMPATELAKLFTPYLSVDVVIDDDDMYVVSGTKAE
jgi:ubiquinone/menaquinone biosynthesis C-methylase UbiE